MSARDPGLAFTDGALQFEAWSDKLWDPMGRDVVAAAKLLPGEKVLDACCGTGAATIPAALAVGPGGAVDGVDLSTGLLRIQSSKARAHDSALTSPPSARMARPSASAMVVSSVT